MSAWVRSACLAQADTVFSALLAARWSAFSSEGFSLSVNVEPRSWPFFMGGLPRVFFFGVMPFYVARKRILVIQIIIDNPY